MVATHKGLTDNVTFNESFGRSFTMVQFIYHLAYMCIYEDDTKDPVSMEIQNGTPLNLDCAACPRVAAPAFLDSLRKFLKEFNTRKRLVFLNTCIRWYHKKKNLLEPFSIGEPGMQMTLKTFHFAGVASMKILRKLHFGDLDIRAETVAEAVVTIYEQVNDHRSISLTPGFDRKKMLVIHFKTCFPRSIVKTRSWDPKVLTGNHIFETVEIQVWVAKMKSSILILVSLEKTTDHLFAGSVSTGNRCRLAWGSSKVSRGRSELWQPRRGIGEVRSTVLDRIPRSLPRSLPDRRISGNERVKDPRETRAAIDLYVIGMAQCLAHVYWWQAGVHRHIFHSPASRSSKNFYSQLTGSQGLLEDLMVLPPLVPAIDQESSKLIVCFRDDDSALPPELLDRDLRDFGVRTNLQMRYSPWAVDMINGMGTCDKKTLKKSSGGPCGGGRGRGDDGDGGGDGGGEGDDEGGEYVFLLPVLTLAFAAFHLGYCIAVWVKDDSLDAGFFRTGLGLFCLLALAAIRLNSSYLVLSVKRLLFSTVLSLFLCLDGERCLVKKEGSPAGIVALFAASMAVMFTAALYHNI
ncbi:hypothetical protein SELMODRAFT_442173 [Selaginella moellendorffii]|uniref:DNA-directed RNA polymerase n=1 Tax=Selaginella moellendorffii TaxID=88036 RepID=D8RRC2_SELML|nr:hypothetical protein SELMODRAFT_442173 [Selaginella moellendorffii]